MSAPGSNTKITTILSSAGALLGVGMWGLSFVATKVLMVDGGFSPTEAYVYRFALAYLIVLLFCHKRMLADNLRDEFMLMMCGILAGSVYFVGENTALKLTSTSNVSLLTSTSPLVTILITSFIYRSEKPGKGIVIGSCIAFVGVVSVIFNSVLQSGSDAQFEINPLGDLLALALSFSWAFYSVILRKLDVIYDAVFIMRKTFFYGVITAAPFLMLEPELTDISIIVTDSTVLVNLLFLVFGPSIVAYYLWGLSVKTFGAVKANNYMYFQSITTMVASAIVLGERISILGYAGFAIIMLGLWLGDYMQRKMIRNS